MITLTTSRKTPPTGVQDKLLLPAEESEIDVYVVQEATISSEKVEEIPANDINDAKRFMWI